MFLGEYHYKFDDKGRMALPPKLRKLLGKEAVVTRGIDNCLSLYSKSEWEVLAEKLSKISITQAKHRAFVRLLLSGAMEVEIDAQGRIGVPEYLRVYADIKKNIVIAGLYNRLEIWSEEKWENYKKSAEKESVEISETLGNLEL
ncbi:MAG: division/cell wall cluster transcriptional repressor MraZ [Parcubacteria group bacterium]|nr:division/cell wall cluster transcriptional repressor MraZ [Parcubacteria group bacterium]